MGRLDPYIELLAEFAEQGGLDGRSFEERFFALFKGDPTMFPDEEFLVLDKLFGDIDAFESDPELRDETHLDGEGLRDSVRDALAKLRHLASRGAS